MSVNPTQRFKLKKIIKELGRYKGRHTELVSVYVPQGYDLIKIMQHLAQEAGTASNIKSTATRKNVTDALEKMMQHLRLFKRTPENGLVVFSGNVAEREGQSDVRVWSIEPPAPLSIRLYRCDKEFVVDPLKDMCEDKTVYGLVVVDRREADIALLKGKAIVPLQSTYSHVPGKMKAGGQSAQRFARLREGAIKDHFKKVAEYMKNQFLEMKELKGIIVGGPGPSKYDFINMNYITDQVKKKIIAIKDIGYTGEFGLQELVDKSQDVLAQEEIADEKAIMQKFFEMLSTKPGMTSYGLAEVKKNLEMGAVDTLILSETLEDATIEELTEIAEKFDTTVKLISVDTREGEQLRAMGKIAALLRYDLSR